MSDNFRKAATFLLNFRATMDSVLRDPKADPTMTILIVSILTILLLLFVITVLTIYFLLTRSKKPKVRIRIPRKDEEKANLSILTALLVMAILTAIAWSGNDYLSKNDTCLICHTATTQVESLKTGVHKKVSCLGCHQRPGITGNLLGKLNYIRWTVNLPKVSKSKKNQILIDNNSCLSCHSNVENNVVQGKKGIRVSHKEIMEDGAYCVDCHQDTMHNSDEKNRLSVKSKCMLCHNARKAETDCNICHSSSLPRLDEREHFRIAMDRPEHCRGCHDIKKQCTVCHGLEMPHDNNFKKGAHARMAFTQKESVCFRCHRAEFSFCNKCHLFPAPHGPSDKWKDNHGTAAGSPDWAVSWEGELIRGCGACHSVALCDACHDDGRRPTSL